MNGRTEGREERMGGRKDARKDERKEGRKEGEEGRKKKEPCPLMFVLFPTVLPTFILPSPSII
jgi:hypothetical protein